jgi:DNA gyrase subunit A
MNYVIEENTEATLTKNFMPYTAHVIYERALPEIDGFKPSQRRILYTMYLMGLLKGNRKKSQGVVGSTMFLHPHGDQSIYETLVRMSKDAEALLLPFIDSKGNFGKQYSRDMKYASARYTEVRLTELAKELFKDIDKDTVDMIESYDGTLKEPKLLPISFPTILVNSQSGTAVGMASNIASFNLNEVIDYTIAYIKNPKSKVSDYILAPDFPTGGSIIYNEEIFNNIFENGRGSFDIRAKYRFEKNSIIFEEMPYTTNYEVVIEKIAQLVKDGKLKEVVDVDDIYGIKSKGIEVTVKKNVDKEVLVEKLFKMTPLQSSFGCNFNMVVNGRPQVLGVKQIIHEWLAFRVKSIKRGTLYDIKKKANKKHLLLALKQILLDIDKAIKIIRETKTNSEVVKNLMEAFGIDKEQAEYVAEIKLRHLNAEYLIQRVAEIEALEAEIIDLTDLTENKKRLALLVIGQLKDVKKLHGQERKSQIVQPTEITVAEKEIVEVDNYNVKIFVSKEGYIKKIPLTSLRGNFAIKVKDDDEIINEFDSTNNSDILIFTDKQNVYKYKAYDLEDHKPSVMGEYLPSLLKLNDENIMFVTVTNDYKGNLLIGYEDGKVAKIELSAYETKQNRSMLKNAYANKKALYFNHIFEDIDLFVTSSINKALLFNTSLVNAKASKTTIGSQIMKEKNDSVVVNYEKVTEADEYYRVKSTGVGKYLKK